MDIKTVLISAFLIVGCTSTAHPSVPHDKCDLAAVQLHFLSDNAFDVEGFENNSNRTRLFDKKFIGEGLPCNIENLELYVRFGSDTSSIDWNDVNKKTNSVISYLSELGIEDRLVAISYRSNAEGYKANQVQYLLRVKRQFDPKTDPMRDYYWPQ